MKPRAFFADSLLRRLLENLLERVVSQTHLIDVRGSLPREQIRLERVEDQAFTHRHGFMGTISRLGDPEIIVTGLDLGEQNVEGLIEVGAVSTGGNVDEGKVAQPVKTVSGFVFRRADGNNVKLRGRLGEEEEENAVEESK